ncbi:MAG: peptide ABC transporter permease [Anaerolineaceae bacterium]|jgi:peptide/nickel transport system permease protein|nr:ABC transporter permease [Anaerolineae bacterium]MBV6467538.1 putative D,D-dipeptide transport system permease protein DdpB [Anaerolineales bacterium]MCE7906401.1 ABC transporter permease [Anaerolineae bacterium CFX3]MDL1925561.1 ABC transporter permease [Anaerolineae bacterium AMX1]OQY82424.1 MAG: peptide ABC transporter permease [Anaerolineae bacterium UTCFX3]GER78579.1 peptide ABC transporter permease [Candidatus Denitrolinea symbiosum]GIK07967.1 MAG: peptide ABC transporter permease [C
MINFIIRRLLLVPLLLFGVTVLIFLMLQFLSPIERSALYVRDIPKNDRAVEGIIKQYGLDKPLYVQYWRWLVGQPGPTGERKGGILFGDFGYSRVASQPVADLIKNRFPNTLDLAIWAVAPIILVGIWLGVQAAVHQNGFIDQAARIFSIVGTSFPTFVFGLLVLMIFYANLKWFPPGRLSDWASQVVNAATFHRYTTLLTFDALLNGRFDVFLDALRHMFLPILTLSYISWATFLRVTRSSMLETLRMEYVTTARSKGLPEHDVIYKHARPNAMLPVVTLAGFQIIGLLGGVVITETVFVYPGIGSAAAQAAAQLDVVTVLGFALFNGLILILSNLVVDVMYAFIDPRVRLS